MQSQWLQLLVEQQHGRAITAHGPVSGGSIGLTPSFLIGAIRTPPGVVRNLANSRGELVALLESMMDNDSGKLTCIEECRNLNQPIASLRSGPNVGHLGDAVLSSDGSRSKLYAWPQYFARVSRDVESLADGLWNILGSSILEGRFSYRDGSWQEFNEDDLAFIHRALSTDKTSDESDEA